jgi:ABC-type proline/glycine betaine transport system ATPase subunit
MKKLAYRLENRATGEVFNYDTIQELFDDPKNDWIKVSIHTASRTKRNSSYVNKVCIITKLDTEIKGVIKAKKIFKIKKG